MKWILHYLFGYSVFQIQETEEREALNCLHACGILFFHQRVEENTCQFYIPSKYAKFFCEAAKEVHISAELRETRGLPVLLHGYAHRFGLLIGLIVCFAILLIAPKFIWELRIIGAENLSHNEISAILNTHGVYVGAYIPGIDRDGVYASVLQDCEDISWLSVNFRGSIATVEIVERESVTVAGEYTVGKNILASQDGIIVDMHITRGRRIAENGIAVKKGDLLVSGIYDTERMGTRFVCAEANVLAEVTDTISVSIPLQREIHVPKTEIPLQTELYFFNKAINIFKNYSNYGIGYDIITRKEPLLSSVSERLPLYLVHTFAIPYCSEILQLSKEEALLQAKKELERKMHAAAYNELLFTEDSVTMQENSLIYTRRIYAIKNIAESVAFTAE